MKTIFKHLTAMVLVTIVLIGCKKDTFVEDIGLCPLVVSTDPANGATNVPLSQIITVTFNEEMDPSTITSQSIVITGAAVVPGTLSYSGLDATFVPSAPLAPNTTYTGRVTTAVKDPKGNFLQEDYVWTFSTGIFLTPVVISTNPFDQESGVVLNKMVAVTFSIPMSPLTINGNSFSIFQGSTPIGGTIAYSGMTALFTPSSNFIPNATYTATININAQSSFGVQLANNHVWSFSTGSTLAPFVIAIDPLNNETNVSINKTITATFSEMMNPSTVNGTTFTLKQGSFDIAGTVSIVGNTASFNPIVDLLQNQTYTATILTGAENLAGTGLANDYSWNFTTEPPVAVPPAINLGSVAAFGIISGLGVSNNAGASQIHNMDVGIYPGARSSITGFMAVDGGPGLIFNGAFYAADDAAPIPAMLLQAKNDLTAAYLQAEGATAPAPTTVSGDLGGLTLAPGIYKSTSTLLIQNGNLTLDAQGDPNAYWIFQIAAGFTTVGGAPYPSPAGGNVILSGGAQAKNVFWQVGTSAVIGDYTSFNGTILALTSVTMNAYSRATGRMLCSNGSVVLTSTNIINKP